MKHDGSNIKKFLIFSEKKAYVSGNRNLKKNFLYFRKWNFLIFQETETLKNFLYLASNFLRSKRKKNPLKKILVLHEVELSSPKLKKLQEGTYRI